MLAKLLTCQWSICCCSRTVSGAFTSDHKEL